ncbi:MAG TPA: hypothetical protein VGB00_14990 [Pyrinomonadaceae bacterium]|jgi:hypothetical protein
MFLFKAKFSKSRLAIFSLPYLCVISERAVHYSQDGSPDTSFDSDGKPTTDVTSQ